LIGRFVFSFICKYDYLFNYFFENRSEHCAFIVVVYAYCSIVRGGEFLVRPFENYEHNYLF